MHPWVLEAMEEIVWNGIQMYQFIQYTGFDVLTKSWFIRIQNDAIL